MANQGLLFIPDISGFSKFINQTEIEHSRLIIQELLEIIIDANNSGLEISEIEGDAILFYRFGERPSAEDLYRQVEKMFIEFHQSLVAYDKLKYCQCEACTSVIELTIKVVTHYGEFTGYKVREFNKLIGKDLIIAHQLLKNDIAEHEYWLITDSILGSEKPESKVKSLSWLASSKSTESGQIPFHYAQLGFLKKDLSVKGVSFFDPTGMQKLFTVTDVIPSGIIMVFHATGDFKRRPSWFEGIQRVEEFSHFLPRVGMKCKCVKENGDSFIYSSSYRYSDDRIEFSETDEKGDCVSYTLDKLDPNSTKVTIDYYSVNVLAAQAIAEEKSKFERSLAKLRNAVSDLETEMAL